MIQNIKINAEQSIEVNTSMGWLFCYKNQFGRDILPDTLPILEALLEAAANVLSKVGEKELTVENIASSLDEDTLENAFETFGEMEFLTLIQMTWAMAKNANDDIGLPEEWINSFEVFPLDTIVPQIFKFMIKSSFSSKNSKRLMSLITKIKVSTSSKS